MAEAEDNIQKQKQLSFADSLREVYRKHNRNCPDDQWDLNWITDEAVEGMYRDIFKVLQDDIRLNAIRSFLDRPPLICVLIAGLIFTIAIASIILAATVFPLWVLLIWGLPFAMATPLVFRVRSRWARARALITLSRIDGKVLTAWADGFVDNELRQLRNQNERDDSQFISIANLIVVADVCFILPLLALLFACRRFIAYRNLLLHLPLKLEFIWDILNLSVSFVIATTGFQHAALFLASLVGIISFRRLSGSLRKVGFGKDKSKPLLIALRSSIRLRPFLSNCFIVVIAFASSYHAISQANHNSFSRPLDILDSVYFSVVSAATVGFGDITPLSATAKVYCMIEIMCSYVATVFVIATVVNVWQGTHLAEKNATDDVT